MAPQRARRDAPIASIFDRTKFSCKGAADLYDDMVTRSFTPQRGFDFDDTESLPVLHTMRARGWDRWCAQQIGYAPELVKEFFANLYYAVHERSRSDKGLIRYVNVRGVPVRFDGTAIERYYGLDSSFGTVRDGRFTKDRISRLLCGKKVNWETRTPATGSSYLPSRKLSLKWKAWNLFIHTSLMPSRQETRIKEENALILCDIAKGYRLNIGEIIHRKIHDIGKKRRRNMVFPQLLTALMWEAGVNFEGIRMDDSEQDLISIRDIFLYERNSETRFGEKIVRERINGNDDEDDEDDDDNDDDNDDDDDDDDDATLFDERRLANLPMEEIETYLFPEGGRPKKDFSRALSKVVKFTGTCTSKLLDRLDKVIKNQKAEQVQIADLKDKMIAIRQCLPHSGNSSSPSDSTPSAHYRYRSQ